jgi:hypothetical protein
VYGRRSVHRESGQQDGESRDEYPPVAADDVRGGEQHRRADQGQADMPLGEADEKRDGQEQEKQTDQLVEEMSGDRPGIR